MNAEPISTALGAVLLARSLRDPRGATGCDDLGDGEKEW